MVIAKCKYCNHFIYLDKTKWKGLKKCIQVNINSRNKHIPSFGSIKTEDMQGIR